MVRISLASQNVSYSRNRDTKWKIYRYSYQNRSRTGKTDELSMLTINITAMILNLCLHKLELFPVNELTVELSR